MAAIWPPIASMVVSLTVKLACPSCAMKTSMRRPLRQGHRGGRYSLVKLFRLPVATLPFALSG